jgi:outer membrane immunogenic protein
MSRFDIVLKAVAVSLAFMSSAYASDLPHAGVIEAAASADEQPWSGCYIGAGIGYLSQTTDTVLAAGLYDGGSHVALGGSIGVRAGCDVQMDSVVLGVVGTIDITDASGSNDFYPVGPGFPEYITTETNWVGSLKGRVGYLVDPELLLYGTAGIAFIDNTLTDYDTTPVTSFLGTAESRRMGYLLGVGAEYALANGWSVFAEYNYMDFGQEDLTMADGVVYLGPDWVNRYDNTAHLLSIGVNYRF